MSDSVDARTDAELVKAANRGEQDAFASLYRRYRDWVYSLAHRFCGDPHDAADVVQETFLYFFNKFPGFKLRAQVKTFLYPAVRHLALTRRKRRSRSAPLEGNEDELAVDPARSDELDRSDLLAVVHGLPSAQREVIMLRFADGLNLADMAHALNVPVGTIKSRLHTALTTLKRRLVVSNGA